MEFMRAVVGKAALRMPTLCLHMLCSSSYVSCRLKVSTMDVGSAV